MVKDNKNDGTGAVSNDFDAAAFTDRLQERILKGQAEGIYYKYGIYDDKVSIPVFVCYEMVEDEELRNAAPEASREACSLYRSFMIYNFKEGCWTPPDENCKVSTLSSSFHFYEDTDFVNLLREAVDEYAAKKSQQAEQNVSEILKPSEG